MGTLRREEHRYGPQTHCRDAAGDEGQQLPLGELHQGGADQPATGEEGDRGGGGLHQTPPEHAAGADRKYQNEETEPREKTRGKSAPGTDLRCA